MAGTWRRAGTLGQSPPFQDATHNCRRILEVEVRSGRASGAIGLQDYAQVAARDRAEDPGQNSQVT